MKEIGCVIGGQNATGQLEFASIARPLVIGLVDPLDSIDAPLLRNRPALGTVHVVSSTIRPIDQTRSFVVNCLAPLTLSQSNFEARLAKTATGNFWRQGLEQLRSYSGDASKPDFVIASDILLAPIRSRMEPKLFGASLASRTGTSFGGLKPRLTIDCGPGTDYACGSPTLPKITVTATPGYPIVIDLSWLNRRDRIQSLSDLIDVDFYGGPDCSNASDTWLSVEGLLQEGEQDANDMEAATSAVADQSCEWSKTENGQDICIDLFIMSPRAAFIMDGDDRTFDPNAPYKASRAQLYINAQSCTVSSYVSPSRIEGFGILKGGPHAPHTLNRVIATRTDSTCTVDWTLLNGFCDGNIPTAVCPAINGKLVLRSDGNGGWTGNVNEDLFPSRGLYVWRGDHFEVISERPETIWLDLMSWRRNVEKIRISRDQAMPPGCNLQ